MTVAHRPCCDIPFIFVFSVGLSATHALVLAQLTCSGAQRGMHAFIVPLRSLQDHTPLPGKLMLLLEDSCQAEIPIGTQQFIGEAGNMSHRPGRVQLDRPSADRVSLNKVSICLTSACSPTNLMCLSPVPQAAVGLECVCSASLGANTQLMDILISVSF